MPPAARLGDRHICPLSNAGDPHLGGSLASGVASVLIEGQPAAVVGDACVCAGPPNRVAGGSRTVFIGGRPAARLGDVTSHGGRIVSGAFSVHIAG